VSQMWNALTGLERLDGVMLNADLCCLSPDGQYLGLLRRHENGAVFANV